FFRQAFYAELHEQVFQGGAVEGVEVGPGDLAATHLVHRGSVPAAPLVGEGGPVYPQVLRLAELFALPDDTGAPVHHGPEDVESERLHVQSVHHAFLWAGSSPASWSAFTVGTHSLTIGLTLPLALLISLTGYAKVRAKTGPGLWPEPRLLRCRAWPLTS